MKMTKKLEKLLTGFYLMLLASFAISIVLVIYFTVFKGDLSFLNNESNNESIQWFDVTWSLYCVIFSGFFAYGILQLKKAISYMSIESYFNLGVISHFKKAGNTFIILGIVLLIFHIVSQLYLNQAFYFLIDTILFCYLFIFTIGIFFKLFGNAFIKGKELLEENNLTI